MSREAPHLHPHPLQALVTALGYTLELNGTFLFLKTPHSMIAGHREIKLGLCCRLSSCGLAFIPDTYAGHWDRIITKGPAQLWTRHIMLSPCLARCAYWHNIGMTVVGAIYYLLVGFKPHYTGEDSCFTYNCRPKKKKKKENVWLEKQWRRGEAAVIALLNRCNGSIKFLSKCLCL